MPNALPEPNNLPTTKLRLKCCWVCGTKFTQYGGPPGVFVEEHHIIPRAYGGTEGPEISLDGTHHTALHEIAIALEKGKPYFKWLTRDPQKDRRLLMLATTVLNAKMATQQDPNKPQVVHFVAKGITKQRLRALKKVYNVAAMSDVVEIAIEALYQRHFQKSPQMRREANGINNGTQRSPGGGNQTLYRV